MPTGIEETVTAVAVETANEVAIETAIESVNISVREASVEVTHEVSKFSEQGRIAVSNEVGLEEHHIELKDIHKIVDDLDEKGIIRDSNVRGELGEEMSRLELERRGNTIIEKQPKYMINPETNKPFRADYKFMTEPGSSFREVVKTGNHYSVREIICSKQQEVLLDVKNHSVVDLNRYLPDTMEKINRMITSSPEYQTMISIPEDTALNPSSFPAITKMQEAGAKVITHAPDNVTWNEVIRRYPNIQRTSGVFF